MPLNRLRIIIWEAWEAVPDDFIEGLVNSWWYRCAAVIEAEGRTYQILKSIDLIGLIILVGSPAPFMQKTHVFKIVQGGIVEDFDNASMLRSETDTHCTQATLAECDASGRDTS